MPVIAQDYLHDFTRETLKPTQISLLDDLLGTDLAAIEAELKVLSPTPAAQAHRLVAAAPGSITSRYRCKSCGKTSNPLTDTPMARLRKRSLWQTYAEALTQSLAVRRAAKYSGVSKNTVILWRHRCLSRIADHQARHESGIVEADETFFLESFQGAARLAAPTSPTRRQREATRVIGRFLFW